MKIHTLLIIIAIILCSAGVAIVTPLGLSWVEQRQAAATAPVSQQPFVSNTPPALPDKPGVIKGTPRHITIKSLGIDVTVADGSYDARTNQWTLNEDSAFYATPTNPINSDSGNTFIYGHATQKIFGNLPRIQKDAEVTVTTDNGYVFTYTYVTKETVKPTDVAALEYSGKPRLTLQTCTGFWNQTREMVYFELKDYYKT